MGDRNIRIPEKLSDPTPNFYGIITFFSTPRRRPLTSHSILNEPALFALTLRSIDVKLIEILKFEVFTFCLSCYLYIGTKSDDIIDQAAILLSI